MARAPDLAEYRDKRDFGATPEPAPEPARPADRRAGPRFVVQRHDARALHFDLRLEVDGALASWAVPKGLPLREGPKRLAVRTEDHPLEYLDFSAVIPAGQYGAGRMTVWDTRRRSRRSCMADDEWKLVLDGGILRGNYHLVRTGRRGGQGRVAGLPLGAGPARARRPGAALPRACAPCSRARADAVPTAPAGRPSPSGTATGRWRS